MVATPQLPGEPRVLVKEPAQGYQEVKHNSFLFTIFVCVCSGSSTSDKGINASTANTVHTFALCLS